MYLIKNAKIITMAERDYMDGADILVDGGKIAAIDTSISAPEAKVIDAKGLIAMPGLIDAHCHIGMIEDGVRSEGDDVNEITSPATPALRAIDGINPRDYSFEEALASGVTLCSTGPGSANVIGGQFALMKTYGKTLDERIIMEPSALKIAFGENPKCCYGGQKMTPMTRMATASILRQNLLDAQDYMKKIAAGDDTQKVDLGKEMLAKALRGEVLVKAHAHRIDDMMTALRIGHEFNLRLSLEHCTQGHLIADELYAEQQKYGTPVVVGPLISTRAKIEMKQLSMAAPGILERAGVRFAMMTDHPEVPIQYLLMSAILAHREGLSERGALACVTRDAAWAIGVDDRVGSLATGKDADIAFYDRDVLDMRAKVRMVFCGGQLAFQA